MKKTLLVVILSFISTYVLCQTIELDETVQTTWSPQTGSSRSPFHGFKFRLSNEYDWHRAGPFGGRIRPYLADNPEATAELNKFMTKRIIATSAGVTAVGYAIGYLINENKKDKNTSNPNEDGPNFTPLIVPVCALVLVDLICAATSNANMRNSVALYNHKILNDQSTSRAKLEIGTKACGIRIAIKF